MISKHSKRELVPVLVSGIIDGVIEDLRTKDPEVYDLPYGLKALDKRTKGLVKNGLNVIASRTSDGKSSFAVNLAVNLCLEHKKVCYITLEDTAAKLMTRMVCNAAKMTKSEFFTNYEERIEDIEDAKIKLKTINFIFIQEFGYNMKELQQFADEIEKPDVLIFDYIQNIDTAGGKKYDVISDFVREFRLYAIREKITVVLLSQINRGSTSTNRPSLQYIAGSGAIEEAADQALLLRYPIRWNNKTIDDSPITDPRYYEIDVAKNKEEGTGWVNVRFIENQFRFIDWVETAEHAHATHQERTGERYER